MRHLVIPKSCSICLECNGSGKYHANTVIVNGVAKSGFENTCYRCAGKGYQTYADVRRNEYYDNHFRRVSS